MGQKEGPEGDQGLGWKEEQLRPEGGEGWRRGGDEAGGTVHTGRRETPRGFRWRAESFRLCSSWSASTSPSPVQKGLDPLPHQRALDLRCSSPPATQLPPPPPALSPRPARPLRDRPCPCPVPPVPAPPLHLIRPPCAFGLVGQGQGGGDIRRVAPLFIHFVCTQHKRGFLARALPRSSQSPSGPWCGLVPREPVGVQGVRRAPGTGRVRESP